MPLISYRMVGKDGLVLDTSRTDASPGAFTYVRNVRFRDGVAELMYGQQEIGDATSVAPYHLMHMVYGTSSYWIAAGLTKTWQSEGGTATWTNITRSVGGDYTATADKRWNGGTLNGVVVLNNGADVPQYLGSPLTSMAALSNWNSNYRCNAIRPHKNFLIAMNITDNSGPTYYPHRVLWSHPADPGSVPSSWDVTDGTKDAGQVDLTGEDKLIDGLTLRDMFVLYKERSMHLMQYVGGNSIFRFQQLPTESGILSTNCVAELNGTHVVFTASDVIQHDGSGGFNSILDGKMRRWLWQNIDESNARRSFVTKNHFFNEVWICFPEAGSSTCNLAIVWNYKNNTLSVRDLPNIAHAATGPISGAAASTWASDSDPWMSDPIAWNATEQTPALQRLVMAAPVVSKNYLADSGTTFSGTLINGVLERAGLDFGDSSKIKLIKGIRPKFKGEGNSVTLYIGTQNDPYDDPTYSDGMTFNIGDDYKADCFVSGRFISFKCVSASYFWQLESIEFDVEFVGDY